MEFAGHIAADVPDPAARRHAEIAGLGIPVAALQPHEVVVDGRARPGLRLDTDPFAFGLATTLDDGRVLTAVIPRDELPDVTLDFVSSAPIP